jgi:preprotein translocase SecE subunit
MAVAVKHNRETSSPSLLDRLPVSILMGVAYILGGVGIAFPLLDSLWWQWLGLNRSQPLWWIALAVVWLVVVGGLVALGLRLLGPRPPKGLVAGIALSVGAILVVAFLAQWLGTLIENWIYQSGLFGDMGWTVGVALTAGLAVLALVLLGRLLFADDAEKRLAGIEEQGWFSTTAYKSSQGQRVRRGTMLGVLVLAGSGVWTLHQGLEKDAADWRVNIPFTGKVIVTPQTAGDNPALKAQLEAEQQALTAQWQARRNEALEQLRELAAKDPAVKGFLAGMADEHPALKEVVGKPTAELKEPVNPDAGEATVTPEQRAEVERLVAVLDEAEPQATLVLERYALRDIDKRFQDNYVKIVKPGSDPYPEVAPGPSKEFKPGDIVSRKEFEEQQEIRRSKQKTLTEEGEKEKAALVEPPKEGPVTPATGVVEYKQLTLLPQLRFSLPLLLLALTFWIGWRLVNFPAFADFLIATEAELNKVSWTSRKKLVQDTIVVLITVFMMTVFLFVADVVWSKLLQGIGVLQPPPPEATKANQELPW